MIYRQGHKANCRHSSIVIDDLISRFTKPRKIKVAIAYLYSDYRDQNAQTVIHILGALLQQFIWSKSILPLPQVVRDSLDSIKTTGSTPGKEELLTLLQTTVQNLERAFICIDALDELEARTRRELLQAISHLVTHSDTLRVFITGRKQIQEEVQQLFRISVDIAAHPDDIRSYLKREIAEDENPAAMDEVLQSEIVSTLVDRSQQM